MPLSPGTSVGPYQIVAPLGAGGMGEVYRARDPRLGRDVAIKALPAGFAQDADRVARFEREAKLLASLNHPNIGAIYGVEETGGARYLVLEMVEGETIAARIGRGPLPLDEALAIGRQVASALEAAHEGGVVHRDLKPLNVMLTPSGGVKVLDFGLAKALVGEGSGSHPSLTASPTLTHAATEAGLVLGTAAYMSPEQARGKAVDRRTDIWALGCLLYELLAGRQAFGGETVSDTLAAILKTEPDWTALPQGTPRRLVALLRRCLRKDPVSRLRDAGDARVELDEILSGGPDVDPVAPAAAATPRRSPLPWLVAAGVLAIAAVGAGWMFGRGSRPATAQSVIRFTVGAPAGTQLSPDTDAFAISPNGRTLALVAMSSSGVPSLWVRDLASLAARQLNGTDNAVAPFWSPDSRSIGFFADGKLKKIALAGGSAEVLCDAPDPRGGTWGPRGAILFAPTATGGIFSVPDAGGNATLVLAPDNARRETALRFPRFLPDGKHFLFVTLPRREGAYEVHLGDVDAKQRWPVTRAGAVPSWAEPGYLILLQNDLLLAQRFDVDGHRLVGEPVSLGQAPVVVGRDGVPAVSVSSDGVMVRSSAVLADTRMIWLDRSGRELGGVSLPPGRWEGVKLSPDGQRAAVLRRMSANQTDVWIVDLARGTVSRFTPTIRYSRILWSPDGRRLFFQLSPDGPEDLYTRSVDGGGGPELLYRSDVQFKNAVQWTADGKFVIFTQPDADTGWDVWLLPVDGDRTPVPLLRGPANESGAWIAPGGRWLVYSSDESGREELYAQSYPTPGARRQLTSAGIGMTNLQPIVDWSADGRELVVAGGDMLAIPLEPGPDPRPGPARLLFRAPSDLVGIDVTSDHRRFLVLLPVADAVPPSIAVETYWAAALGN